MKILKFVPAVLAAAALSLCACGDDDPVNNGEGGQGGNIGGSSGSFGHETPEEVKERVADIASSFLDKFNPNDQKELIDLVSYLSETYGDVEFEDDDADWYYSPMRRLASSNYEIIDIVGEFPSGIYTPVNGKWQLTSQSSDIIFRIPNDNRYGRVELAVKHSGSQNITAEIPYDDNYKIIAPTAVEGSLTAGGKTMISEKLNASLNTSSHTLTVAETTKFANIEKSVKINGTNSQATSNVTLTVGGSQLVNGSGTLNGKNLCDINKIAQAIDDETIESFFTNASVNGNVMNQLYANGTIKAIGEVINAIDRGYDYHTGGDSYYDYTSAQDALAACEEKAVKLLKRNVSGYFSFSQGGNTVAKLTFITDGRNYTDPWSGASYGLYEPKPALEFSDGTTYTDDFFEYGFDALINQFETLVRAYERLVD